MKAVVFVLIFWGGGLRAERIYLSCDFFRSARGHEASGYLNPGTEVHYRGDQSDGRAHILLRVYIQPASIRHNQLQPGCILFDSSAREIGRVYTATHVRLARHETSGLTSVQLSVWIPGSRIDPASVPELVIENMCRKQLGKWPVRETDSLLQLFPFTRQQDTMGFSLWRLEDYGEARMTVVTRKGSLVALIPERPMDAPYFEAELRESELRIIYFEKLKSAEERFFADHFKSR